jgi:hypothetical protein
MINPANYHESQMPKSKTPAIRAIMMNSHRIIQSSTDTLRVNAQLIDAESGAHLWAGRFDKPRKGFFDMQDSGGRPPG